MSIYGYGYLNERYIEEISITSEELKPLWESSINKIYLKEDWDNFTNRSNDIYFNKFGDGLVNSVKDIKEAASEIFDIIKQYGVSKAAQDKINIAIENLVQKFANNIDVDSLINKYPELGKYDKAKIIESIILTLHICTVNTLFLYIVVLITGFNMPVAQILTACIAAPINEEMGKRIAIKGGFSSEYTLVFNIIEASSYVLQMVGSQYKIIGGCVIKSISFIQALKLRLPAILMHITTTIVQFLTQNKKIQEKIGLNKPEDKAKLSNLGYILGMIIHGSFNFFVSKEDSWLSRIVYKFAGLS